MIVVDHRFFSCESLNPSSSILKASHRTLKTFNSVSDFGLEVSKLSESKECEKAASSIQSQTQNGFNGNQSIIPDHGGIDVRCLLADNSCLFDWFHILVSEL